MLKFLKGLEKNLPTTLELGAVYHCTDTGNTYMGINNGEKQLFSISKLSQLGITATAQELNTLDGITATVTELNYSDGLTSNIQTQLNNKIPLSGVSDYLITGNLMFSDSGATNGVFRGLQGKCGNNDYWRIGGSQTGSDAGYLEISTADDGNEPIYVKQYSGVYSTLTRTATLLDENGNTTFPGTLKAEKVSVGNQAILESNGYITGTRIKMTADTSANATPNQGICVKHNDWIYTRTFDQIRGDINAVNKAGDTMTGNLNLPKALASQGIGIAQTDGSGYGIALYGGESSVSTNIEYGIYFAKTSIFGTHGSITGDWATYFSTNSAGTNRGWIFRRRDSGNVASISGLGDLSLNGTATIGSKAKLSYDSTNECLNFSFV